MLKKRIKGDYYAPLLVFLVHFSSSGLDYLKFAGVQSTERFEKGLFRKQHHAKDMISLPKICSNTNPKSDDCRV